MKNKVILFVKNINWKKVFIIFIVYMSSLLYIFYFLGLSSSTTIFEDLELTAQGLIPLSIIMLMVSILEPQK